MSRSNSSEIRVTKNTSWRCPIETQIVTMATLQCKYNEWRQSDDTEAVVSTADGTLTGSARPREPTCVFVPVPFKH